METVQPTQTLLTKPTKIKLLWSLANAIFWVIFMWRFWDLGFLALGVNTFVYLSSTLGLFLWSMRNKQIKIKENWTWLVPIGLVITSFLIYDNPFIKITSFFLLPLLFAIFFNYGMLVEKTSTIWTLRFLSWLSIRILTFFAFIWRAILSHINILPTTKSKNSILKRIIIGIILFLLIALLIIVPLLSSADAIFATQMNAIGQWLQKFISLTAVYKIIVAVILSIIIIACVTAWTSPFNYQETADENKKIDPIISGIVLGGILILYLLFLGIQLKQLWVGSLPFDFKTAEYLVKSGFWQLLFIAIINIAIYFFTYRKTIPAVQKMLAVFMLASLLMLASAGHRMVLYVWNYGFSYEKFAAMYAVIFCAILLIWLISRLLAHKKSDVVKFILMLFLWMYGLLAIFPMEQFILRANVALAKKSDSRIRLFELKMLSPDVLGLVKKYEAKGKLKQPAEKLRFDEYDYLTKKAKEEYIQEFLDWKPWITNQEKILQDKKWYEKNLMNLFSK